MKLLFLFALQVSLISGQTQKRGKDYPEGVFRFPKRKNVNETGIPEDIRKSNSRFECGKTYQLKGRIFRGENATFGNHPWNAAIFQNKFSFMDALICGGVLINENFVLTAANCVAKRPLESLKVKLGEHNIGDQTNRVFPNEVYKVERKIIHGKYNDSRADLHLPLHDIALLELDQPVRFKKHILPICLPKSGARFGGEIATVSGWGDEKNLQIFPSPKLKQIDVLVVENDECEDWAADFGGSLGLNDTHLCAGFRKDGGNICFTDTGGPLILETDKKSKLIGIVSTGIGPLGLVCGMPYFPAIYTNVSNYVDWIESNTNIVLRPKSFPGGADSSNCSSSSS